MLGDEFVGNKNSFITITPGFCDSYIDIHSHENLQYNLIP